MADQVTHSPGDAATTPPAPTSRDALIEQARQAIEEAWSEDGDGFADLRELACAAVDVVLAASPPTTPGGARVEESPTIPNPSGTPIHICRALGNRCEEWPECPCSRAGYDPVPSTPASRDTLIEQAVRDCDDGALQVLEAPSAYPREVVASARALVNGRRQGAEAVVDVVLAASPPPPDVDPADVDRFVYDDVIRRIEVLREESKERQRTHDDVIRRLGFDAALDAVVSMLQSGGDHDG